MIRVNKAIQEKIRAMGKRQADALRRGSDEETFFPAGHPYRMEDDTAAHFLL